MPTHKEKEKQVKKERKNLQSNSSRDEQTPPPKRRGKFSAKIGSLDFSTNLSYACARQLVLEFWGEDKDAVLQFRQGMSDEIVYLQMKEEKERKRRKNDEEDKELRKKGESASV